MSALQVLRTSILVIILAAAGIMFGQARATSDKIQQDSEKGKVDTPTTCTVCHRRVTTITGLDCAGLDYRRHKDHGDPDGACAGTNP